jgi:membrane-associated phospholipid phosphatase
MYKLDAFLTAVGPVGELLMVLPVAAILVLWCWLSGERRGAVAIGLATVGVLCAVSALKLATNLTMGPWRPHWSTISNLFPSGHVAMALVVYGALVLCLRRAAPWLGWPSGIAVAVILLALGVERVVHGSHPPLDVAAGAALGAIGLFALVRLWPSGRLRVGGVPAAAIAIALTSYAFYGTSLPTSDWVGAVAKKAHATVGVILGRL